MPSPSFAYRFARLWIAILFTGYLSRRNFWKFSWKMSSCLQEQSQGLIKPLASILAHKVTLWSTTNTSIPLHAATALIRKKQGGGQEVSAAVGTASSLPSWDHLQTTMHHCPSSWSDSSTSLPPWAVGKDKEISSIGCKARGLCCPKVFMSKFYTEI